MSNIDVSIVVTTRNRKKELLACIESIKKSNLSSISWELVVVDDASSDGTQRIDKLDIPNSKILHNKKQKMMVATRNRGAREVSGEYILFIDEDNEIDPKMIKVLFDSMKKYKEYGVLGPAMHYFDSKEKYLDFQSISLISGKTYGIVSPQSKNVFDTDGVPNVFMIRREVFEKCGYFDEELIQTFTEPDFSFSIRKQGYKSGIVPDAITYHKISKSKEFSPRALGGMYSQKAYCLMRNRSVLIRRYGDLLDKIFYFVFFSWLWPLIYTVMMLRYKKFDLIRLYWLGFRDGLLYFFTGKLISSL